MTLYLPIDLNLDGHFAENPPFEGFKRDKMHLILSTLVTLPVHNKDLTIINGFVPLSSEVLQSQFKDYKKYLNYGLNTGLLVCDDLYIVGSKCKGYKIGLPYSKELQAVSLHSFSLRKQLNKRYQEICKSTKGYEHLNKWFDGLSIDRFRALRFLKEEFALKNAHYELRDYKMVYDISLYSKSGKKGDYKKVIKDPVIQYHQGLLSMEKLREGQYSYHVDDTVHRYHSVLTNMRSSLRNFLTYKGSPLVSIDIKNSQPYLLCLLLQPSFWASEKIVRPNAIPLKKKISKKIKIKKPILSLSSSLSVNSKLNTDYTINYSNAMLDIDCLTIASSVDYFMLVEIKSILEKSRFDDYIEKATSGKLYDSLQEGFEQILGYALTDRKELKSAVFQVLFTPNNFIGQEHAAPKRIFRERYPEVYAVCNAIKKKNSKLLPKLLQQLESHIMLHVVAKRLQKEHPKAPIFTVHDSIMTTPEHADLVKNIMLEELTRCVGFTPSLALETLIPEKAEAVLEKLREKAEELSA